MTQHVESISEIRLNINLENNAYQIKSSNQLNFHILRIPAFIKLFVKILILISTGSVIMTRPKYQCPEFAKGVA